MSDFTPLICDQEVAEGWKEVDRRKSLMALLTLNRLLVTVFCFFDDIWQPQHCLIHLQILA